jgi:DNA-binding CsgD family transcriptional regulator
LSGLPQGTSPFKELSRADIALWGKENTLRAFVHMGLTPRQAEVFTILMEGRSNAEIGDALCITTKTVRFHLTACYRILKVKSRCEAIVRYRTVGA